MPANPGKSGFRVSAEDLGGLFEDRDTAQLGHFGGAEGLCEALQVDANNGLPQNPRDAPERVAAFGANSLPDPEPFSFLRLVWLASQDRTLLILSGAAIISLILGLYQDFGPSEDGEDEPRIHWIEGTAILATVLVVILAESLNDYNKEKQFRKLNAKKEERDIVVIRQGDHRSMSVHDLLVGDIALLEPGDIAPADGILLEQSNLRMDESTATGESEVVRKTLEDDPFILSGTSVAEGTGRMIVCCVGQNSFYGRTLMAMKEEPEDPRTPLEIKLDDLAERIAKLGWLQPGSGV